MQPPNEELSAQAQALLQAHRDAQCPEAAQEERVWQRVHHSAFIAPAALLVDPLSQAAGAGQGAAGAAKAAVVAGGAKGGLLSTVGAKIVLAAGVSAGVGVGALALQGEGEDAPEARVAVEPTQPKAPGASNGVTEQPASTLPDDVIQEPAPALALTPELRAQLGVLSAIDEAIRKKRFSRARTSISDFYTSYAASPFASDISALELILQCHSKSARSEAKLQRLLKDPKVRRYWARIKKSCLK